MSAAPNQKQRQFEYFKLRLNGKTDDCIAIDTYHTSAYHLSHRGEVTGTHVHLEGLEVECGYMQRERILTLMADQQKDSNKIELIGIGHDSKEIVLQKFENGAFIGNYSETNGSIRFYIDARLITLGEKLMDDRAARHENYKKP